MIKGFFISVLCRPNDTFSVSISKPVVIHRKGLKPKRMTSTFVVRAEKESSEAMLCAIALREHMGLKRSKIVLFNPFNKPFPFELWKRYLRLPRKGE